MHGIGKSEGLKCSALGQTPFPLFQMQTFLFGLRDFHGKAIAAQGDVSCIRRGGGHLDFFRHPTEQASANENKIRFD